MKSFQEFLAEKVANYPQNYSPPNLQARPPAHAEELQAKQQAQQQMAPLVSALNNVKKSLDMQDYQTASTAMEPLMTLVQKMNLPQNSPVYGFIYYMQTQQLQAAQQTLNKLLQGL